MPKFEIDPTLSRQLNEDLAEIEDMLNGNKVDFNDPVQADVVEEKIEAFKEEISELRPPDPSEEWNASARYADADSFAHKEPGEGGTPGHMIDGQFVADAPTPEAAAESAAKEEDAEKKETLAEEKRTELRDLKKELLREGGKLDPNSAQIERIEKMITKLEESPEAIIAKYNQELEEKGRATPETQRAFESLYQPESQPLPAGLPAGSKWIDGNTIQLPDGTKIRHKGRR